MADGGAPTKKGAIKNTKPTVLLPVQVVRVRCACDSHDPPAPPPAAKTSSGKKGSKGKDAAPRKPSIDPWIRGLYVIWAPKPADGTSADFMLGQTDLDGHLSIPGDSPDTWKIATHEDQEFLFWFVRTPDPEVAKAVKLAVAGGDRQTYGAGFSAKLVKDGQPDPKNVTLATSSTGKDAKGRPVTEPVLSIPADPSFFVPAGSKLYDGWSLFHVSLPDPKTKGTKQVQVQPLEACTALQAQVRRLQHHLGALRFLVGDHGHPYAPVKPGQGTYPNDGVFDLVTWNSVLRFHAEATAGTAEVVPSQPHQKLLSPLSGGPSPSWGAPTALASTLPSDKNGDAFQVVHEYAKSQPATGVKTFAFQTPGLVDSTTGDALVEWLQQGYRKPGGILVSWVGGSESCFWVRDRAYPKLVAFDAKVKQLGFTKGVLFNHTFRDARVDALGAGFGRAKRSIHKTGYAFDHRMHEFQPVGEWPVKYAMEKADDDAEQAAAARGHRIKVKWRIYAPVDGTASTDPADQDFYKTNITPWKYDAASPMGGAPLAPDPGTYIDYTAVAYTFGIVPIHSFGTDDPSSQDWRGGPRLMGASTVKELGDLLGVLISIKNNAEIKDTAEMWLCDGDIDAKAFAAQDSTQRMDTVKAAGGNKVDVSSLDLDELEALVDWIGVLGKNAAQDLSLTVEYHQKAEKDPDKAKDHLVDQLKARFTAILKPPKNKAKRPFDGHEFECLALEDGDAGKAGSVLGTVKLTADSLKVDGDGAFPKQSFRIRPKHPKLGDLPYHPSIYLPRTVGNSIGMEWWHFQLETELAASPEQKDAARARALQQKAQAEADLKQANADLDAATAQLKDPSADHAAAKAAIKDAHARQKQAEADRKAAHKAENTDGMMRTWWSLIQEIGWVEEAMRSMGYGKDKKGDDFSEPAR